jgi:hypothetical protein
VGVSRLLLPLLLLAALASASPVALAAETSAPFRLQGHHAARRELAFHVFRAGLFTVQVESGDKTPLILIVTGPGGLVVHSARIVGSGDVSIHATAQLVGRGREWSATVMPEESGADASGRIRVTGLADPATRPAHDVDRWLDGNPAVALHMAWRDADGLHSYSAWPESMRVRLRQIVDDTRRGSSRIATDPPPNAWRSSDAGDITTAFTPDDAREVYLASVAHSLRIEIDRLVPWSVKDLNEEELDTLFSSHAMFRWHDARGLYEIAPGTHGWAVPVPSAVAFEWLQTRGMLRGSRHATLLALVEWSRGLSHFAGATTLDNFSDFWGYRGGMPVARALEGTRYAGSEFRDYPGYDQVRHYTAGCHGTVGLLVNVLRAANIPTRYRAVQNDVASHATILFLSEDLALSHGDDPYSQAAHGAPTADILIDRNTYERWLGPLAADPGPSIGRQPLALALDHLPPFVRELHALDRTEGRSREASRVFEMFRGVYSRDDLERRRLWERLDRPR